MTLRTGHGNGAGVPRVEVMPADELPLGVQAEPHAETRAERTATGRWTKGTSTAQSKGGKARKLTTALASRIGLGDVMGGEAFKPYKSLASRFRKVHVANLAQTVGGGICGTGPSSMVASAALALAASRFLYDTANGDASVLAQASRLANDSRQNLLAAHELCAKEAQARAAAAPPIDIGAALRGDPPR